MFPAYRSKAPVSFVNDTPAFAGAGLLPSSFTFLLRLSNIGFN